MSSHGSFTDPGDLTESAPFTGRRILVIEDSPVAGEFTADLLSDLGCEVVGPAPTMAAARELALAGDYDAAILDIHIRGERVFPLCELLDSRGVPFVLTSGYADWHVPEKWRGMPCVPKPYTIKQVEDALRQVLKKARPRS